MKMYDEVRFPEPPELRSAGVPPLKIQLKYMLIMFVAAFLIAFAFAIIFKVENG